MSKQSILRAAARGIRPPPIQSTAEWAEKNYFLPPESAAEPGLISFKRTPYSYGIMDAIDDPSIEFVSLQMAAQLAKTTVLLAILGKIAATPGEGAPVLFLMPIVDNAEMMSKERFAPMVEASPKLKEAKLDNKVTGGGQKVLQKRFRNGTIVNFIGTNAPANLASRPVKYILADECDRFAVSAGKEGDPLQLAIKRTSTFKGNGRKVIVTSTPTLAGISVIERQFAMSDQRHFFVPCPHCGHKHVMQFENIYWEGDDPDTAYYLCPNDDPDNQCGAVWSEADRLEAISKGEWIATRPEVKGHAGFFLNALASPWVGQAVNAAKEYIDSRGNPMLEQVFVNTYLGETYSSDDLKLDEDEIIGRMTAIGLDEVPEWCLLLTAGVDVQGDRVEVQTWGHGKDQSAILDHRKITGDPTGEKLWSDLDEFLQTRWSHALGNEITIEATAIDSGYMTQTVYDFVGDNPYKGYYAIKGVSGHRLIWDLSKSKKLKENKLYIVGTDDAKGTIMEMLKNGDRTSQGYIHIADMGMENAEFAKQLLAEYRAITFSGNRPVMKWERKSPGHRAEVLDCAVYATAVRTGMSPNWEMRIEQLTRVPDPEPDHNAPVSADITQQAAKPSGWAKFDQ